MKPFYITTTLPYVNASPHIGHALEFIRADIIARSKKIAGHDVFFNTGTDEHGIKVYQKAKQLGIEPQTYVDQSSVKFKEIIPLLGLAANEPGIIFNFIRTTDSQHVKAAQDFWKLVDKNGFIYKKNYSVKYCVGCELEKTDSELVDGHCPIHPQLEIETIKEENYFFKFSAFQKPLAELYEKNPALVVPDFRFNEIKAFVGRGLDDFSISRLTNKMPWGIPVPGDENQVMYVWFDALVNYISAIGWLDDQKSFKKWWIESGGVVQYCGKDNLRQQSAMWQSMLMAAGLPPSKTIVIDGFITGEGGVKMSKSLGNTVDPFDLVKGYGTDALRYWAARELSPFEDSPFTPEKFKEAYNAGLANGIGNLTSRILKLTNDYGIKAVLSAKEDVWNDETNQAFLRAFENFNIQEACNEVWKRIAAIDRAMQDHQPFKLLKSTDTNQVDQGRQIMSRLQGELWFIAVLLEPILPETALTIQNLVKENRMPEKPLFMRK